MRVLVSYSGRFRIKVEFLDLFGLEHNSEDQDWNHEAFRTHEGLIDLCLSGHQLGSCISVLEFPDYFNDAWKIGGYEHDVLFLQPQKLVEREISRAITIGKPISVERMKELEDLFKVKPMAAPHYIQVPESLAALEGIEEPVPRDTDPLLDDYAAWDNVTLEDDVETIFGFSYPGPSD